MDARRKSTMHTQNTLSSQTEDRSRSLLTLGGGFCVATGLALLAIVATPARGQDVSGPTSSQAVAFVETPALRDIAPHPLTPEEVAAYEQRYEHREELEESIEKNPMNSERVKAFHPGNILPFVDRAINNFKNPVPSLVTNPIANFDGPDADAGSALFGGRTAPPDTNGAVGPNNYMITTNLGVRVYDKTGTPQTALFKMSSVLVGIPNASDDDGDPVVLYDALADRWILTQFNLRVTSNTTHTHIAVSKTGDPTGAYYAYDFLGNNGRAGDYPHMTVWPDGYYMSTNDFTPPLVAPFLGASCYAFERAKMLVGDATATRIGFALNSSHGGMLPTNFQGYTAPPVGTPNVFFEFLDAGFNPDDPDFLQSFALHADYAVPANSTLTDQGFLETLGFDARTPSAPIQQPAPGEALQGLNDRLMHALNFRVLPGGVQSFVLNFTVNVSGVNPTTTATYQGGIRWMELRRNPGTGALTVNQQATYAPGSGNGATGRDLWMGSVAQDGEGNIALVASATDSVALKPTAVYTGRLASDPPNTLPQGEVDALLIAAVVNGVQTATSNRWGDYSSVFIDPADDCTFWAALEYVDAPTASFDWDTRIFSFKVNSACVTSPKGTINGTITNCASGLPVQNAIATAPNGYIRQTNASGTFSMTVSPGDYFVFVNGAPGSGLGSCFQNVTVPAGGTATVTCCLGAGSPTPPPPSPTPRRFRSTTCSGTRSRATRSTSSCRRCCATTTRTRWRPAKTCSRCRMRAISCAMAACGRIAISCNSIPRSPTASSNIFAPSR